MPGEVICVAKETRSADQVCGIRLERALYGYGHTEPSRWRHYAQPRVVR